MDGKLSNLAEAYERRVQVEKLTPIGRAIIENFKPVRVDSKTVILVKPENFKGFKNEILFQNGKHLRRKK